MPPRVAVRGAGAASGVTVTGWRLPVGWPRESPLAFSGISVVKNHHPTLVHQQATASPKRQKRPDKMPGVSFSSWRIGKSNRSSTFQHQCRTTYFFFLAAFFLAFFLVAFFLVAFFLVAFFLATSRPPNRSLGRSPCRQSGWDRSSTGRSPQKQDNELPTPCRRRDLALRQAVVALCSPFECSPFVRNAGASTQKRSFGLFSFQNIVPISENLASTILALRQKFFRCVIMRTAQFAGSPRCEDIARRAYR